MGRTPSMELSEEEKAYFETGEADDGSKEEADALEQEAVADEKPEKPDKSAAKADEKPSDKEADKAKDAKEKPDVLQMVDKKAMDAERERRKRVEKEKRQEEIAHKEQLARLQERLDLLNRALVPADKPETPPAPGEDPIANLEFVNKRLTEWEQQTAERQRAQEQQQRQQAVIANIEAAYRADAAQFSAETPEFTEAYQYLIKSRTAELAHIPGFRNNPTALAQAVRNDELSIVHRALQSGESPAEVMFGLAKIRGWNPAEQAKPQEQQRPAKDSGADEVRRLAQAQEASTSLSKGGGSAGGTNAITLDALDRMSDDELKAFIVSKNKRDPHGYDKWMEKQMVGGR